MSPANVYDAIIVGGGPAGTAAAIAAQRYAAQSKASLRLLLLEHGTLPRQKVCGEFVSADGLELLRSFLRLGGQDPLLKQAPRLGSLRLITEDQEIAVPIRPAAASIPRWELDAALWQAATALGQIDARQGTEVEHIERQGRGFAVRTRAGSFLGRSIVNASGRWSKLTPRSVLRQHDGNRAPKWIGLKAHFRCPQASADGGAESTSLYFGPAGYCGVQPAGRERLNACAMVRAEWASDLTGVFALNAALLKSSRAWEPITAPVATAPLLFRRAQPLFEDTVQVGDAASFIDPFVGSGITLAMRSGVLAARSLLPFWLGRSGLEEALQNYRRSYERECAPAARHAAWLRLALNAPRWLRKALLSGLRLPGMAAWVMSGTR